MKNKQIKINKIKELKEWIEGRDTSGLDILTLCEIGLAGGNIHEDELLELGEGYKRDEYNVMVKIENIELLSKLEDFLKTEIYPLYADQIKYILI